MKNSKTLFLLISLLFVSIMWVVFTVYHTFKTSTISEKVNQEIKPISPDFDSATIEKIKSRQIIVPQYDNNAVLDNFSSSSSLLISNQGGMAVIG